MKLISASIDSRSACLPLFSSVMLWRASSILPLLMSHRGDSGKHMGKASSIEVKMSGKRQGQPPGNLMLVDLRQANVDPAGECDTAGDEDVYNHNDPY